MKSKLWKKICKRIRIIEKEDGRKYEVQIRYFYRINKEYRTWQYLNAFDILGAAISQKHYYIENFIFRNVGIGGAITRRRKKMKMIKLITNQPF